MRILGIQDYKMPSAKYLDKNSSVSWLRAFEKLASQGNDCYAICCSKDETNVISDDVFYTFTDNYKKKELYLNNYDVIMFNFCWYKNNLPFFQQLKKELPTKTKIVMRTHHELGRVLTGETLQGYKQIVDQFIVSDSHDVYNLGETSVKPELIPFGINTHFDFEIPKERDIDVATSIGDNIVKRGSDWDAIRLELRRKGFVVKNLIGIDKKEYLKLLARTKVYVNTSSSEASGSRSLLESIALGCSPVSNKDCKSALEIIEKCGGRLIDLDHEYSSIENVHNVLKHYQYKQERVDFIVNNYSEELEIEKLCKLFNKFLIQ